MYKATATAAAEAVAVAKKGKKTYKKQKNKEVTPTMMTKNRRGRPRKLLAHAGNKKHQFHVVDSDDDEEDDDENEGFDTSSSHGSVVAERPAPVPSSARMSACPSPLQSTVDVANNWTYSRLYGVAAARSNNKKLYGNADDQIQLRLWLNEIKVPQNIGDVLLGFGARSVKDALDGHVSGWIESVGNVGCL